MNRHWGGAITLGYKSDYMYRVPHHFLVRYYEETKRESLLLFYEWADELPDADYMTESDLIIESLCFTPNERRIQKLQRLDQLWRTSQKNIEIS